MTEIATHTAVRGQTEIKPFDYARTPIVPGRTLVEASAGTGKTFAIAGLVLRLVLDADWLSGPDGRPDLRRLLVVTFTNAATEELKTRIRAALRTALAVARGTAQADSDPLTAPLEPLLAQDGATDRLLAALDRVDEAGIFTIHGFCKRVLEEAAFESGTPFDMEFVEDGDSDALRTRAAADAWARLTHDDHNLAALALQRGLTPDALSVHHKAVADFPSVRIVPEEPALDDARAALAEARTVLGQRWDAEAVGALLAEVDWNSKSPFGKGQMMTVLDQLSAYAAGTNPDGLEAVGHCTPAALTGYATTRSKAQKEQIAAVVEHPAFRACEAVADAARTVEQAFIRQFVRDVDAAIDRIKAHRAQLTFGDLITRLHDALHAEDTGPVLADRIRRRYAVALIDEFQDTDPLQYGIFKTAFHSQPLYFVGDPKQAIYAFRGADVHAYLGAQREADRRFTLGTNWRSTARLVEAVNRVFQAPERPFLFDGIPFHPVAPSPEKTEARLQDGDTPPLVWWPMPSGDDGKILGKTAVGEEIPTLVAAEIQRLLVDGRMREANGVRALREADIAVLVPTRYEAESIRKALERLGIPAIVSRTADVRESVEMAEVEFLLRAILQPGDDRALRAALSTELWGWSAHDLAALDDDHDRLDGIRQQLRRWQKTWRRNGLLGALSAFQQEEAVLARLLAHLDGERRVTNLRHTAELLHEVEQAAGRSPEDLMHWLRHRTEQMLPSREMKELRLERDADAVQITTHHNAKGLEWEIVFLPYLWSVSERDYTRQTPALARTPDGVVYDLGSDDHETHDGLRQFDALAEHVRKAYVALTRARERCYVVWGAVKSRATRLDPLTSLGYLLAGHDADDEGVEHLMAARKHANLDDPLEPVAVLAQAWPDLMRIEEPRPGPRASRPDGAKPDGEAPKLFARALPDGTAGRVTSPWRMQSFSAWASGKGRLTTEAVSTSGLAAADEPQPDTRKAERPEVGIHAFAAGPAPGTCLHEILQHVHFDEVTTEEGREKHDEIIRRALERHGLADRRRHRAAIAPDGVIHDLLVRLSDTPVLGPHPLSSSTSLQRMAEWRFVFPLGRTAPHTLAALFREHGTEPFGTDYADSLALLSPDAVDGFMAGIVDLVVHHEGRWWILDWKSNTLGPDGEAYTHEALVRAMHEHHYGLQLHLYTLGLHRYLRTRMGDAYDYDRDIGGATYVFLRGLQDDDSEAGLVRHRPSFVLIDALDRLLGTDA